MATQSHGAQVVHSVRDNPPCASLHPRKPVRLRLIWDSVGPMAPRNKKERDRKRTTRGLWIAAFVITMALMGLAAAVSLLREIRPLERSSVADVSWELGREPFVIEYVVVDLHGNPAAPELRFWNESGWNSRQTGPDGTGRVNVAGPALHRIETNGVTLFRRDYLGAPALNRGLRLRIVIKDLEAVGLADNVPAREREGKDMAIQ